MLKNKSPLAIIGYTIAIAAILFSLVTLYEQYYVGIPQEGSQGGLSLLYVQTAHSGTLSAPQADNKRILTLSNVDPTTVYFSDRPNRITGHNPTQQFINEWNDGDNNFSINPPNAALDMIQGDSQSIVIVELFNPVYDAVRGTLQYEVIILGVEPDSSIPESFNEAALFIDKVYTSPEDYYCGCQPSGGEDCICGGDGYHFDLGGGEVQQFRGYCSRDDSKPSHVLVAGRKSGTTCTIDYHIDDYYSRSCTNWDLAHSDGLDITVYCRLR